MHGESQPLKQSYRKHFMSSVLIIAGISILTAIAVVVSVSISQYHIGFSEAFRIMLHHGGGTDTTYAEWLKDHIVWDMNLPRAIGGVAVGVILGVGGAVMQSVVRNPLADPYTTGISSGAMFGVTVYLVLCISVVPFAAGDPAQIFNAFVFALIPAAVIIFISSFRKTSPTMMVLIGIGVMYIFAASTTLLKFTDSSETIAEIYTWGIGAIGRIGWSSVPVLLGAMMLILLSCMVLSRSINLLSSGDSTASSLGMNPYRMRLICLVIVSVSTAVAVCFSGTIGFVCLVSPHIARMTVGSNVKSLIPCSAAVGGFMLIAADCIARNAGATGLPVGVITALIGSPLFLYFLIKQRKSAW